MIGSWIVLGIYVFLMLWIVTFIIIQRDRISRMASMMAAMSLGMSIGLGVGTIVANWFPDNFFLATMISMFIGAFVGVITGISSGLMAVMEGLLAGIMGGMMGAMLMVMIPSSYIEPTIKMISILCYSIVFLIFLMLRGEIDSSSSHFKASVLTKPSLFFGVIVICFLVIYQTPISSKDNVSDRPQPLDSNHPHHMTGETQNR